jgi:DNA-binding NtrC family response regulator
MVINSNPTAFPDLSNVGFHKDRKPLEYKTVQKGKVIIVDDEIEIVNTLQAYLSGKSYKTLGCTSGKRALETLKKYEFDILLADLVMPEIGGIELLESALEIDPHLIGIIITGNGSIQSAVDAMKAGAFDYLMKPFDFELLSLILTRAMKVRGLSKSEDQCRSIVEELHYQVRELQNVHGNVSDKELEIFELKEEIESLKEALKTYQEMEKNLLLNGNGINEY